MPVALSPVVWKLIVDDDPNFEDVAATDVSIKFIGKNLKLMVESGDSDMSMVHQNSVGEDVELVPGGRNIPVTLENYDRFINLLVAMRIDECREAVKHIRAGLAVAVPIDRMNLWSWRDIERRVCGEPTVDIALLKKYAYYENTTADSPRVRYLWGALEEFGQDDRTNFVRFCWGRSRLPPDGSPLWIVNNKSGFRIKGVNDLPQGSLPRSHTCFFTLDLPDYASQQQATDRIRFAVRNCVTFQID